MSRVDSVLVLSARPLLAWYGAGQVGLLAVAVVGAVRVDATFGCYIVRAEIVKCAEKYMPNRRLAGVVHTV